MIERETDFESTRMIDLNYGLQIEKHTKQMTAVLIEVVEIEPWNDGQSTSAFQRFEIGRNGAEEEKSARSRDRHRMTVTEKSKTNLEKPFEFRPMIFFVTFSNQGGSSVLFTAAFHSVMLKSRRRQLQIIQHGISFYDIEIKERAVSTHSTWRWDSSCSFSFLVDFLLKSA